MTWNKNNINIKNNKTNLHTLNINLKLNNT